MLVIPSDKLLMVDVDDTLVLWDKSEYSDLPDVSFNVGHGVSHLKVHPKNINLVRKFHLLGYTVVVWSQTGYEWAKEAVKKLGLEDVVYAVMSKPRYHLDDLPADLWMGTRLWRSPYNETKE